LCDLLGTAERATVHSRREVVNGISDETSGDRVGVSGIAGIEVAANQRLHRIIGHCDDSPFRGILADASLVAERADRRVVLDVALSSNVALGIVPSLNEHPVLN
jgi:hypothetical protein